MSIGKGIAIAAVWIGYAAIVCATILTAGTENASATVSVGILGALAAIFVSALISEFDSE